MSTISFFSETWLHKWQNGLLQELKSKGYKLHYICAMSTFSSNSNNARKGMLWIINQAALNQYNIDSTIESHGDNLSIVKLELKTVKKRLWILGVYLTPMGDDNEFKSDLNMIKTQLNKIPTDDQVVLIGDFNADPTRYEFDDSAHTTWRYRRDQILLQYCDEMNLCNISLLNRQVSNYSLKKRRNIMSSRLDHIIINNQICIQALAIQANIYCTDVEMSKLVGARDIIEHMLLWEDPQNQGDHRAISLTLTLPNIPVDSAIEVRTTSTSNSDNTLRLKWYDNSTVNNYNGLLWLKYETSSIYNLIQENGNGPTVTINLLEIMAQSIKALKPNDKTKYHKTHSWWDAEMTTIKQKRDEWYKLKHANDEQSREVIANNFGIPVPHEETCIAKLHYYKLLFKIKQKEKIYLQEYLNIKKLRYYDENDKSRMSFWKHVKSLRREDKQIINLPIETLADQYSNLFNESLTTNTNIDNSALDECCEEHNKIIQQNEAPVELNPDTIANLMSTELKNNKAAGPSKLSNEAFKYITCSFIIWTIKYIFEQIINLGQLYELFNTGLITLLIKDSKKPNDDLGNLRPIMLSDTLANLYEKLLLKYLEPNIILSPFQFGFRPQSSCAHAVTIARETIIHYNSRGKPVYSIAVDFTKAFDKLNRPLMFKNLIKKLPGRLWSAIYCYYKTSKAFVVNNNETSRLFTTSKGVKQGGPMSPFLFASFIDDMLKAIANDPSICRIGSITTGVIAYADDIFILCETIEGLTRVTETLVNMCDNLDLVINQDKTKIMTFGNQKQIKTPINITIHGKIIECVTEFKYLGVILTSKLNSTTHVEKRIEKFHAGFYGMGGLGILNGCLGAMLKSYLLRTYCLPILLYGTECIELNYTQSNRIKRTYTLTLKRCLALNKLLHTESLLIATGLEPFQDLINKRKIKCFLNLIENQTTHNIIKEIIAANNFDNIWHKKSSITELRQIIYSNEYNPDDVITLKNDALTKVVAINSHKDHLQKSELNQRLVWLLNNPSTENWKTINELLIPDEIADLQATYWNEMIEIETNTESANTHADQSSLNSSGFLSDAG
jgi:hypothetical protein